MGLALGGITKTMCDMMDEGPRLTVIVDAQVFDTGAIEEADVYPKNWTHIN